VISLTGVWYAWKWWSGTLDQMSGMVRSEARPSPLEGEGDAELIESLNVGRIKPAAEGPSSIPRRYLFRTVTFCLACCALLAVLIAKSDKPWLTAVPAISFGGAAALAGLAGLAGRKR
jgi:hypothetical protein